MTEEVIFRLPSAIEVAAALESIPHGPHHETVRRMAVALDLMRGGGREMVKIQPEDPQRLPGDLPALPEVPPE